ncbi:hypothetical protein BH23BAC1_BH23BAC1_27330 [soil metagenome]
MKKATPNNNLLITCKDSSTCWEYSKNIPLIPENFLPKSQKEVWWLCKNGHSYLQRIAHFTNGIGCPYCKNKKASNTNNLACTNPELLNKWNYEKNIIKPEDILPGSDKVVWWKCEKCFFEWKARVANITKRRKGCPKCHIDTVKLNNVKLGITRSGILSDNYPKLIEEWDFNKNEVAPDEISIKSGKKVWWRCKKGHSWNVSIKSRIDRGGTRCPLCNPQASKQEIGLFLVLRDVFPNAQNHVKIQKINVDVIVPSKKLIIELDGHPWHWGNEKTDLRKNNTLEELGYFVLRVRDSRLKDIGGNVIQFESKDSIETISKSVLKYLNMHIELTDKQKLIVNNILASGEDYFNQILSKVINEHFEVAENKSVKNLFPNLLKDFSVDLNEGLDLSNFTIGSNKVIKWKCHKCNHIWNATIVSRVKGRGCQNCARKNHGHIFRSAIVNKKGNFLDRFPGLKSEWNWTKNENISPYDYSAGSQVKVWWKCNYDHEWQAIIKSRTNGTGCPFCKGRIKPAANN